MDLSHIKPFAFDRIFAMPAAAGPAACAEDLQLQVTALEAEAALMRVDHETLLAATRAEAFDAGMAQARGEQAAALLAAVDALQSSIELTGERMEAITARLTEDAAQVALAAAEMLAARALDQAPGAAVDQAIGRVLRQVARGQDVLVRVHPSLAGEIERLVAVRQSGERRQLNLHVVADPHLAVGDAHIEWDQGGLSLDAAARAAAVRAEMASLLHAA